MDDPELQLNNCINFLTVWFFTSAQRGVYHVGLVFCRFIYVRLASGLVKDGAKMLHWVTIIIITVFILLQDLMWPVRCLLNGNNFQVTTFYLIFFLEDI